MQEIAEELPISRPAVSRHLRVLKDAGLVAEEAVGTRRIYHLEPEGALAVRDYLERVWGEAAVRFRLLAENTRRGRRWLSRCAWTSSSAVRPTTPSTCGRTGSTPGGRGTTPRRESPALGWSWSRRSAAGSTRSTPDGTEHEWGEVTAWEPPRRLAYLWHLRTDRDAATEVEIRFVPDDAGTRVEIEHAGWERLGDAADAWRERNVGGWAPWLPHFVAAATTTVRGAGHGRRAPRKTPGS